MKHFILIILLILPFGLWASGSNQELGPGLYAEFKTNRGNMIFRLDHNRTPLTVTNFCGLAEGTLPNDVVAPGEPYFDGLSFYRDAPGYAIFSGDPAGNGDGGPGYTFPRETGSLISTGSAGALIMDGFSTEAAGSRFFITREGDAFLDTKYTAFGRMISGSRTLKKLRRDDVIESITIIRVGGEARRLRFDPAAFAEHYEAARAAEIEVLSISNIVLAETVLGLGPERQKTPTGIYYLVLNPGEGGSPSPGSRVSMHYTGTLLDGTEFDSSRTRGQTFDFVLGQDGVIPGWIEMVMGMQPGEIRKVVIPPYLGYGDQGYGPIEPDSWLIFEMELVSFLDG